MIFPLFHYTAFVIYPVLLPFAGSRIKGIIAFAAVITLGAGPVFEDDAAVEYPLHFAVASFFAFGAESLPFTYPEIKLPVNRVGRAGRSGRWLLCVCAKAVAAGQG